MDMYFFSHIKKVNSGKYYECCSGNLWKYAIPFEGNENLVGTISDPDQTSLIKYLI